MGRVCIDVTEKHANHCIGMTCTWAHRARDVQRWGTKARADKPSMSLRLRLSPAFKFPDSTESLSQSRLQRINPSPCTIKRAEPPSVLDAARDH